MRRSFRTTRASRVRGLAAVVLLAIGALLMSRLLAAPPWTAAAPREPSAATVAVAPETGASTDTFIFSLTGFTAGEAVTATFTAPQGSAAADFPPPDALTTTVDSDGSGSLSLRPVDQGLILTGTWAVTFTGQTSGATQTARFELAFPPGCGC